MATPTPRVEGLAATPADRPVVERLLQLYEYDVSAFMDQELDDDGLYRVMDLDALWRPGYHVFLVRVNGRLAGFAFVTRGPALLGPGKTTLVDEFFVLRKHRRRGVGERVARTVFDAFPGPWEAGTSHRNPVATAFWRRVIARHTGGAYREAALDDARWRGPVWAFTAGTPPA
jgi:predicted acetyltransferase